jgi:hypothetical protein
MRFFPGLHRIVIVLAICVSAAATVYTFSEYRYQYHRLDDLRTGLVDTYVDGVRFNVRANATPREVETRAKEEEKYTGVPSQDVQAALNEKPQQHREYTASEEKDLARYPVFWFGFPPAVGLMFYGFAMTVLLVGRWIIRGFLTPPAERTDATPSV